MNQDKSSPYYLGARWPNAQPAFFFRPAKVKQPYRTVEFDPRYRLPLYRAVFHDAIVSSHHWNYDNLKFSDVQTTRSLLSQLYNTAPMFHLSRATGGPPAGDQARRRRLPAAASGPVGQSADQLPLARSGRLGATDDVQRRVDADRQLQRAAVRRRSGPQPARPTGRRPHVRRCALARSPAVGYARLYFRRPARSGR